MPYKLPYKKEVKNRAALRRGVLLYGTCAYSFILHFPNRFAIFIKMGKIVPPERSRTMELYKKTYRVSEEAERMVEEIAAKENCTETAVFENAIRCYRDYLYVHETMGPLLLKA